MIQWLSIKLVNVCFNQPDAILSVVATILLHLLAGVIIGGTFDEAKQSLPHQLRILIFVLYWEIYIILSEIQDYIKPDPLAQLGDWRRPKSVERPQNALFYGPGRGVGQIPNRLSP